MDDHRRAKKFLLGGAIVGGIMSLSISLMMDMLFADSLQGTWRESIAHDVNTIFSLGVSSKSIVVTLIFMVILGILAAFGAFMGYIFSFFLYKFFGLLSRQ